MKIVVTAEQLRRPVPGGIGTYVKGLLGGLASLGEEVTVLASKADRRTDPLNAFPHSHLTSRLPSKLLTQAWERGFVKGPNDFDVLHATSFAYPAPKSRLTVTVHDLAWRAFPEAFPPHGRRWHEAAMNRTIASASRIVVPSSQVASDLMKAGVAGRLLEVIPHGSDHLPEPDVDALARRLGSLGLASDSQYLLAVGTMEPRKNLSRLIAAYDSIRADLPVDMPLLIVGAQGWGEKVRPVEGVHLVAGASDAEVAALYQSADLVAYVPLLEGYGLPVIEAMHAGTPVVASAVPSAGQAAFRVDPENVAGIAEGLLRVASDDLLRDELVVKAKAHAARTSWEQSARLHRELWQSVAQ